MVKFLLPCSSKLAKYPSTNPSTNPRKYINKSAQIHQTFPASLFTVFRKAEIPTTLWGNCRPKTGILDDSRKKCQQGGTRSGKHPFLTKSAGRFGFDTAVSEYFQVLIRRYSFALIATNEDDFQKERNQKGDVSWCEFFWEQETWSIIIICGSAFSPKTFHRQPRRDPVNVEFVLFEFTDIPAVLAVDVDEISPRFYYLVDGETHLG